MAAETESEKVRVACTDCHFETVVPKGNGEAAKVIVEHGRETGHKLTTEELDPAR